MKVTEYTQYPTDAFVFRFTSIELTIPEILSKECLTLKKHIQNCKRKFAKKISSRISPKSNQVISMIRGDKVTTFCSDSMSGSYFIVQTRKFLLINASGQRKIIQYIPYILCPKSLRFGTNTFDVISIRLGGSGSRNELKTSSHPRPGDFMMVKFIDTCDHHQAEI